MNCNNKPTTTLVQLHLTDGEDTKQKSGKNREEEGRRKSASKTSEIKGYSELHMPTRMGLGLFSGDKDYPRLVEQRLQTQQQLPHFIKQLLN